MTEERDTRFDAILCRGGRTGRKIHRAYAGSSTMCCGFWTRTSVQYFKVSDDTEAGRRRFAKHLCESCFSSELIAKMQEVSEAVAARLNEKKSD